MKHKLPDPIGFCDTDFTPTTYEQLAKTIYSNTPTPAAVVDFSNTHITVLRKINARFRMTTDSVDFFIPDSTPLMWCVNWAAGRHVMPDRVYGPEFMKRCISWSPGDIRHYFLGASQKCLEDLLAAALQLNPSLTICGSHHGYFPDKQKDEIGELVKKANPDILWIGLGTPKQQELAAWLKHRINHGWILNAGFAFDVTAGHKHDAPLWMQRVGLTWLFRLASEPARLGPRYIIYNSLFLILSAKWLFRRKLRCIV